MILLLDGITNLIKEVFVIGLEKNKTLYKLDRSKILRNVGINPNAFRIDVIWISPS